VKTDLLRDLVLVSPLIAVFVMSLFPIMIKVFRNNREANPYVTLFQAFIGLSIAIGLTGALSGAKQTAFHGAIVFDGLTAWMGYLLYSLTGVALLLSFEHIATKGKLFSEYVFLVLNATVGMMIVVMSNDLLVTFIGIEMMSLCLYILCAMGREGTLSKEAAFKYFVLGSFASAVFLYGIAFIYGTVGSTFFPDVLEGVGTLIGTNLLFLIGLLFVILGFAFKVSVFPLHAWTPDVYQGAATPLTAYMATAVKAATFIAFLRLLNAQGYGDALPLQNILQWLAVLTMLVGNVAAILQDNFKRMLAYSSVAHSGYLLIGLLAAGFGDNYNAGATSVVFYLFSYSLMTIGTFALVGLFEKHENASLQVSGLRGLSTRYPLLAFSLTVLLLSLAGIPPTLGFFGKLYLFSAAIEQNMYWLVFWGVINSVISVYYYLRPVVMMYMSDQEELEIDASQALTRATVVLSAILIVILGVFSSPVLKLVQSAVTQLF